jgi:hypothetical protein
MLNSPDIRGNPFVGQAEKDCSIGGTFGSEKLLSLRFEKNIFQKLANVNEKWQ